MIDSLSIDTIIVREREVANANVANIDWEWKRCYSGVAAEL